VDSPNSIEWNPIEMKFISLAQHNTCVRHQNPTTLMLENKNKIIAHKCWKIKIK
jgi:hypothetical protein